MDVKTNLVEVVVAPFSKKPGNCPHCHSPGLSKESPYAFVSIPFIEGDPRQIQGDHEVNGKAVKTVWTMTSLALFIREAFHPGRLSMTLSIKGSKSAFDICIERDPMLNLLYCQRLQEVLI
jgi:hypothetical protein